MTVRECDCGRLYVPDTRGTREDDECPECRDDDNADEGVPWDVD